MGSRILIVEDDLAIVEQATHILEAAGHTVECTKGPGHLVHADVVLADVALGFDRIAELAREAPVLVLTAWAAPELIAKALEAGASGHVVKPLDCSELRDRVAELAPARVALAA